MKVKTGRSSNAKRLRERLCEAQNQRCAYCFHRFGEWGRRSNATIDEVVPRSKGGKRNYLNCVAACLQCNCRRGSGSALQFAVVKMMQLSLVPAKYKDLSPTKRWRMWKRGEGPHPKLGRPPEPIRPELGWW